MTLVYERAPAAVAGLKPGDVILRVGNQTVKNSDDFLKAVSFGQGAVEVEVARGRVTRTVTVVLAPWPVAGKDA